MSAEAGATRVDHATAAALRRSLTRLKAVPTLPKQLEAVARALEDPDVDFESIAELIEVDQALTSQTLRLANSAFYSTQGKVGRVSHALVVLGAVVTRSLVLSSAVFDMQKVSLRGFWEHSLGCAVASGALAKVTGLAQPEEATAAGLLHDLGKVILFKELPDVFGQVLARATAEGRPFRQCERELLGVDHCDVASWLVDKWGFPACLSEPIHHHHAPGRAVAAKNETAIVHVANSLVRALAYGFGGDALIPPIDPVAWAQLRLSTTALDRVIDVFEADLDQALNFALFE